SEEAVRLLLAGFISSLPVLIEDIPGVGKTTLARALAAATGLDFGRIQFTPDLLPGDIIGMTIWSQEKRDFVFKPGSIMHQFILADEINRASARTQSALLEAMQEGAVSVDSVSYPLPDPFFLVATQNPLSFAGTFKLPEAQVDRFGISFSIGYPDDEQEETIIRQYEINSLLKDTAKVMAPIELKEVRKEVRSVRADDKVVRYIVQIANETRRSRRLKAGISPRASQHLFRAAQASAFLGGRDYVLPEDVRSMAIPVLNHRIVLSAEARLENESNARVIDSLLRSLPMPSGI
ncbi:MAG TPA: MoxR family ATPase, partial [Spirochaetia bacterium]|nr:MoxR family ATPase [Spirochaetia bacterium]